MWDCILQAFARCTNNQMLKVVGRLSPTGRLQGRAFGQWRDVIEERKQRRAAVKSAVAKMSPEGRAKGRAIGAWRAMVKERKRRAGLIKQSLARMTPEGRAKYTGLTAFKSKCPTWEANTSGPEATVVYSSDRFWITTTRHRVRESVFGTPVVQRGLFRFAFRVHGGGTGVVVGVADASNRYGDDGKAPMAWGLHLTHGALYTKRANSDKGVLSTKQLVPQIIPDEEEDGLDENGLVPPRVVDIEVEVDMDRRKVAFGLPGLPLVQAPVKLSGIVRPWVYVWEEGDSIALSSRPIPQRSHAVHSSRTWRSANPRTAVATPLRERGRGGSSGGGLTAPPGSPFAALVGTMSARTPSHAETGDYLPPYAYDIVANPETPGGKARSPTPGRSFRAASPASAIRAGILSARAVIYSSEGRRQRKLIVPDSGVVALAPGAMAAAAKPAAEDTPQQHKGRGPSTPAETPTPVSAIDAKASRVQPALSARRSPRSPRDKQGGTHSERARHARATSRTNSPPSIPAPPRGIPRGLTRLRAPACTVWDMVRYVSGVYSDVYRQL